jgi:hypothetical protein
MRLRYYIGKLLYWLIAPQLQCTKEEIETLRARVDDTGSSIVTLAKLQHGQEAIIRSLPDDVIVTIIKAGDNRASSAN